MYHFFTKNEELKSKKESKTSTPNSASWGPNRTSWTPISTCWGPIYTYLYISSILSKSPIYIHATIHLRNNGAHHTHYTNVQSEGVEYSRRLPKNLRQGVEGLSPS
jgi:hypothetical protein